MRYWALIFLILLVAKNNLLAQSYSLSEVQQEILREQAMELIANYNANLNSLGDPTLEVNEKELFIASMVQDIFEEKKQLIYNDLQPGRKAGEHLPAEMYLQNIITQYAGGLEVTFNNIKLSDFFYDEVKKRPFIKAELKSSFKGKYIGKSVSGGESLELYIGYKLGRKGAIEGSRIYAVEQAGTGNAKNFKKVALAQNAVSKANGKPNVTFVKNSRQPYGGEEAMIRWSKFTSSAILTDDAIARYQPVYKNIAWKRPFTTFFSLADSSEEPFARPVANTGGKSKENIKFTSPLAGKKFKTGSSLPISWTYANNSKVKVELLRNGKLYKTIYDVAPGVSARRWTIPGNLPGSRQYAIRVSSLDDPGISLTTNSFRIVRKNSIWQRGKDLLKL